MVEFSNDFEVIDLGELELDVYDIEVDGVHNFFANDILVHNSNYLDLEPLVARYLKTKPDATTNDIVNMLDAFCAKVLQPEIDRSCQELADYLNAYEQRLSMKREAIAEAAIWSGKKRYTMLVWDNEGVRYKEPELKVQGLESVRSSTPAWSRGFLREIYRCCLTKQEADLHNLFRRIEQDFNSLPPEEIAVPTGVNGIEKYSDANMRPIKGAPMHVRAAINHNRLLKELGIHQVAPIQNKEKIKYIILKPNPRKIDVVAFRGKIPEEFDLLQYVDKQAIMRKSFLEPAQSFAELIKWNLEYKATLDLDEDDIDGPVASFF